MRIIARKTLRTFWEKYPGTETPLKVWFKEIQKSTWKSFNHVKSQFPTASIAGNDRVVLNIKGNTYRLIAAIDYEKQILWIRFIGTHNQYNKIDARSI